MININEDKKIYEKPNVQVIMIQTRDIITTSPDPIVPSPGDDEGDVDPAG